MDQSALPTMCRGGCGFYGSSATEGYCSKCFKDTLKRKQDPGHSPTSNMTPKAVDVSASRDRILATAMESLVTPHQASCSGILAAASSAPQLTEKADVSASTGDLLEATAGTPEEKSADSSPSSSPQKQQKNRCDSCRKRVGLTGFQCRCGGMFCATHRYSDMHECSFDYQALGKEEIRKNNPVIKTEKVLKL